MAGLEEIQARLDRRLEADDAERTRRFSGPSIARQPVHTAYVPADGYTADTVGEWGRAALTALDAFGPLPTPELAAMTEAVRAKLEREPIEDLRIDFEDGYGVRSDEVEDGDVERAAAALAASFQHGSAPPFAGIRIKSFDPAVRSRGLRTLHGFLAGLLSRATLPAEFRITLPKVTSVAQVEAMTEVCAELEAAFGLPSGALRFEIQVETPQAVLGPDGTALVAPMIGAAAGRCAGLHFGTYDYTASLGVSAALQSLEHPAADHAKAVLQVAVAGTGIPVSDGSTNVLPVGDSDGVRQGWALHARLVRRSLDRGFYQGWDLHPAQLPTRYAATYAFYREGFAPAAQRLAGYLDRLESAVAEEPATAQALSAFLLRALHSGACEASELAEHNGLTPVDLGLIVRLGRT